MDNESGLKTHLPQQVDVQRPSTLVHAEFAALTHPGKVRKDNEDHYLVMRLGRDQQTLLTNLPKGDLPESFKEWGYVMVVADGLGGEAKGELASSLAVSAGVRLGLRFGRWNLRIDDETAKEVMERAEYYYQRIHDVVAERADSDPSARGMGTTLTIAFTAGNEMFLGHVGDSRAYLLRSRKLYRLTHDQTLAQLLADKGKISQKDVDTHHLRNVLTEAIGVGKDDPKVQVKRLQLDDGDTLLLCTDGLTEMIHEDEIKSILIDHADAQDACAELVKAALDNGGRDNVTVVLGKYKVPT